MGNTVPITDSNLHESLAKVNQAFALHVRRNKLTPWTTCSFHSANKIVMVVKQQSVFGEYGNNIARRTMSQLANLLFRLVSP